MEAGTILYKLDSKGKVRTYEIERSDDSYWMITGTLDGKKTQSKPTVAKPKNVGRANATTGVEQAITEIESRYTKKKNEGYYDSEELARANPDGEFFNPMLATEIDKVKDKDKQLPLVLDPKLDGMRQTSGKKENVSRKGKPIPTAIHIRKALEEFHKNNPTITLDGELYNHEYKADFNALMSLARKAKPNDEELAEAAAKLEFHCYDLKDDANPNLTAVDRKIMLDDFIEEIGCDFIVAVDWELVTTQERYDELIAKHLEDGFEGSIARTPDSIYINKRAKHLMKIKQFFTEEYTILDIESGKGNKGDIAGRVTIDVNGVTVGCGIRGTWSHCEWLLKNRDKLIGKQATIWHFGKTLDGSLRFPVCIDVDRPD